MSEFRLVIRDASRDIHGISGYDLTDAVWAALCAEPESIDELDVAIERFRKPNELSFFDSFSRGLNDITAGLPGVVEVVRQLPAHSVVLDGEALGISEDGQPRIFQETMSGLSTTLAYFFDVLHVDDASVIDDPLASRRALLSMRLTITRSIMRRMVSCNTRRGDIAGHCCRTARCSRPNRLTAVKSLIVSNPARRPSSTSWWL